MPNVIVKVFNSYLCTTTAAIHTCFKSKAVLLKIMMMIFMIVTATIFIVFLLCSLQW